MRKAMAHFAVAVLISVGALAIVGGPAWAAPTSYKADLKGSFAVPPSPSSASGTAEITFDPATRIITWTVTYTGLAGPATAGHLEAAMPSASFPDQVIFSGSLTSPITGQATLTDPEVQDLFAGRIYVTLYTSQYPGGEIRGQVK
jgi:hypothetical protein